MPVPPSESPSDKQLARWVLRAQLGDRDALDRLLSATQTRLLHFLRQRMTGTAEAEDCLQAVLIRVCRKLHQLREPLAFRGWMYRIAVREADRMGRDRQRLRERELDLTADVIEQVAVEEAFPWPEHIAAIPEFLGRLPANTREVLFLHYMETLTLREVSAVLEKPLGTIKSRLAYGLQKLRETLPPLTQDHPPRIR